MSAVGNLGQRLARGRRWLVLAVAASSLATGCKSGSWAAKPAWWSFGQNQPAAGSGLAAAPTFEGDATKPSATAKPYPTTSTPQGYVLDGAGRPPAADAAPVTYGVTPPPAAAPANLAQWSPPAAAPAAGSTGGIAPQVGPYATNPAVPASPPVAASEPPAALATVPPMSQPAVAPATAARMADARAASPDWTGSADAVSPPSPAGRYGAAGSSRFSGAPDAPATAAFSTGPAEAAPPPAVSPPASPFSAPAASPATMPAEVPAPGALPPLTAPAATPRRPDPVYRPGGTSSYRPGRSSIAADDGGVQPAAFESRTAIAP
jgi:hypothetical protein